LLEKNPTKGIATSGNERGGGHKNSTALRILVIHGVIIVSREGVRCCTSIYILNILGHYFNPSYYKVGYNKVPYYNTTLIIRWVIITLVIIR